MPGGFLHSPAATTYPLTNGRVGAALARAAGSGVPLLVALGTDDAFLAPLKAFRKVREEPVLVAE